MEFETERLILRHWKDSDAEELYKHAKDPQVGPAAGWFKHTSVAYSRGIIRSVLLRPRNYAVVLKSTGKPVGSIAIMLGKEGNAPLRRNEAELSYWLGSAYWGQGLIPEAVRELLRHCFADLGCTAVWCGYYEGNEKSKRVQEKCGFVYHHCNKDRRTGMGDVRTEHFTCLSKQHWQEIIGENLQKNA